MKNIYKIGYILFAFMTNAIEIKMMKENDSLRTEITYITKEEIEFNANNGSTSVRLAQPQDLEAFIACRNSMPESFGNGEKPTQEQVEERFNELINRSEFATKLFVLFDENNEVIGFFNGGYHYQTPGRLAIALMIDEQHRNQKIVSGLIPLFGEFLKMVHELGESNDERFLVAGGVLKLVYASVTDTNEPTKKLLEEAGFFKGGKRNPSVDSSKDEESAEDEANKNKKLHFWRTLDRL